MENRLRTVTAIILRSHEYGEGNKIYSLLTREEGKRSALARGICKPRAKLAASLQHFTLAEIYLAHSNRQDIITQVKVINPFYALRHSLEGIAYASYFCELFDESLAEEQEQPELFDLLSSSLHQLCGDPPFELLARYLELQLIALSGYSPSLTNCACCRHPLTTNEYGSPVWPTWVGFSTSQGGALCSDCMISVPGAKRIAAATIQIMILLLHRGVESVAAMTLSARLRREIEDTLHDYLEYRLERRLQSVRVLKQLLEIAPK